MAPPVKPKPSEDAPSDAANETLHTVKSGSVKKPRASKTKSTNHLGPTPSHTTIPFTPEETQTILDLVQKHGQGDWAKITDEYNKIHGKTQAQIRTKFHNLKKQGKGV
ncbi:hypothetical protein HK104_010435 [Borealophlyctis nickersoniae]|nr:hypothetical protein HK104_010435 [Borealophlyctis nickersoniae]